MIGTFIEAVVLHPVVLFRCLEYNSLHFLPKLDRKSQHHEALRPAAVIQGGRE
jgi:hypothetical protein